MPFRYLFEKTLVENYPAYFKPILSRIFLADKFLLFRLRDHVEKFQNYLNKRHKKIKFTSYIEENGSLSFLDTTMTRENNTFVTSVYRKPTSSDIFTNFKSFIPQMQKLELTET